MRLRPSWSTTEHSRSRPRHRKLNESFHREAPSGASQIGHPLSDGPLPHGQIMDAGIVSYHEFACSRSTLSWMQATGLPSDADLQIVEECVGGFNLIVKAWPKETK